jgi:hypothetical protein
LVGVERLRVVVLRLRDAPLRLEPDRFFEPPLEFFAERLVC